MKLNRIAQLQRREFLRRSAQLGLAGVAAPWALNLAAIGQAAAADSSGGYKALVCLFLYGGNDYGATLMPADAAGHANLVTLRGGNGGGNLVTPRASLAATTLSPRIALTGPGASGTQLAMSPALGALKPLFDAGQLGWLLNVGTLIQPTTKAQYQAASVPLPPKLFSHNDQQSVWQAGGTEGSTKGWGGTIGDLFLNANSTSTFTCINASSNAVFMSGQQAVQYQVSNNGAVPINGIQTSLFGSTQCAQALRSLITAPRTNWMEAEYNRVTARSITAEGIVKSALPATLPFSTVFDTTSSLHRQLQMVARLIAARSTLGAQRQVFFVSLGGFDNHDFLVDQHPGLLTQVGSGLATFHAALTELGGADRVTTFTGSDFGRTLTSNGDGSDHGWGSHHIVMGGAVQGRRFWGDMPVLANNGPSDVGQGRLLPSTSVDQLAATLAKWMGVSDTEMRTVVPNIGNFSVKDLGFFSP
ncbi:MAG: DUF1501 domain-containing protein [Inhella sp.]|uniref:DUF1501 domain-containing protein n=1 Tax=Inhella sp. TaxID=1921806 RepID=UPI00391A00DC